MSWRTRLFSRRLVEACMGVSAPPRAERTSPAYLLSHLPRVPSARRRTILEVYNNRPSTRLDTYFRPSTSCYLPTVESTAYEGDVDEAAQRTVLPALRGPWDLNKTITATQKEQYTHIRHGDKHRPRLADLNSMHLLDSKHVLESSALTSTFSTAAPI